MAEVPVHPQSRGGAMKAGVGMPDADDARLGATTHRRRLPQALVTPSLISASQSPVQGRRRWAFPAYVAAVLVLAAACFVWSMPMLRGLDLSDMELWVCAALAIVVAAR